MDGPPQGSGEGEISDVSTDTADTTSPTPVPDEPAAPLTGEPKTEKPNRKWKREPGLALSFRRGLPVDGKVEKVIRGGYEVRVGKARGFCPHSQMDLRHVDSPETHVGRVYRFAVAELRRGGEEAILSRRILLEEERGEEAKAVRATLVEGSVTQGHVARVTDFGVFVDLGAGVTGLVHVSELAHGHVAVPADLLKTGDTVQVKVLRLEEPSGRVSLSIRQAAEDPWASIASRYEPGQAYSGIVRRLTDFGAFVEMCPGVEALAPADGFPPGPNGWRPGLEEGQSGTWRVVSLEPRRRRMSIQPLLEGQPVTPQGLPEPGARVTGRVQRVEKFGVFVWLGPGRVGLVPSVYTGTRKGTDLSRVFPTGKEIEVEVLEADADGRRIRLSVPGAVARPKPAEPRSAAREPSRDPKAKARAPEAAPAPSQAFGTSLRDVLGAALKKGVGES